MNKFLYNINADIKKQELCNYEMKCIFNQNLSNNYIISNIDLNKNKSPFIKSKLEILYQKPSLEELLSSIKSDNLSIDNFKIEYQKIKNDKLSHKQRLDAQIKISHAINGIGVIHNPKITYAISNIDDTWYFGLYEKNSFSWRIHNKKPYSYCNAMECDLSRSIINIATKNNTNPKIIDPCCGIGTVVMEALEQGYDITGIELAKPICINAIKNLLFFNYKNVITHANMFDIKDSYDVAILDIPYGIMSHTTIEEQKKLIQKTREISKELILIASCDMTELVEISKFKVQKKITLKKSDISNFTRTILICK